MVHVIVSCLLGNEEEYVRVVDDFIRGTHAWELTRVDTLDDFSCLESYLNESGELEGTLGIYGID